MKISLVLALVTLIALLAAGCATRPLSVSCQPHVPAQFQQEQPGWKSPTGESEATRYKKSYEAFWWMCIMVKAEDLETKCPSTCSGTAAAIYGCTDGAMDAESQVFQILGDHSDTKVKKYLQSLASDPKNKAKIEEYFPNAPVPKINDE